MGLVYDDPNFFLDVEQGDADLIKPSLFGSSNNYVFMDGSARMLGAKLAIANARLKGARVTLTYTVA